MDEQYMGTIFLWAPNFIPANTVACYGQMMSISSNTALFSLLGTLYGGDGRTIFGIPDFRGRIPVGTGTGPGLSTYIPGSMGGIERYAKDANFLPAHTHVAQTGTMSVTLHASSQDANTTTPVTGNKLATVVDANGDQLPTYYSGTQGATVALDTAAAVSGSVTIDETGSHGYIDNRQPYTAVNYILVAQGLYPSRS